MRRLLTLAVSVLALCSAVIADAPATRADASLVVRASEASVNFPSGVSFRLEAEGVFAISDVQLQVNTPGQRYGAAVRNVRPSFTPGERVSATWTWARFGSGLPPGTEITYRWRITQADGSVTETPQSSVRVEDTRQTWQELQDGPVTVRWYRGDARFGRELLAAARDGIASLRQAQGVDLRYPITVHVYGSQAELFQSLPGVPGWVGGISIPEFDTVMIGIEPTNLAWGRRAMTHEIAHQIIFQMTAHPTLGSRVPTWLNEGLAVASEGEMEAKNRQLVADAVAGDALPTLRNLSAPFSGKAGHLAGASYAASESAVRYLLDSYGAEPMRTLLLAMGEGSSPDEAARRAYGRSMDQLEDGWRASLSLKPYDRGAPPTAGTTNAAPAEVGTEEASTIPMVAWLVGALGLFALIGIGGGVALVARRARRSSP